MPDNTIKTTEQMLTELQKRATVDIKMTEQGVEFYNDNAELLFLIPFAGAEENKEVLCLTTD